MVNRIEELEKVIAKAQSELEVLRGGGKRWRGNAFDRYWFINDHGEVVSLPDDRDEYGDYRYSIGNYFRTKEEAKHALKRMIATQQIKDRIAELNAKRGWVADWSDANQSKGFLTYDYDIGKIGWDNWTTYQHVPKEFIGSPSVIKDLIKEMPEQIKLWLGVE